LRNNDILDPSSIADSVYSLIDLSDAYLLMAADSLRDQPECRPDKMDKNALNL